MGVIVDDSAQKEFDQLEAKGAFSLADTFRKAHEVSLDSLAFMTFVPAKYQALVANSTAYQAVNQQHDAKAKHEKEQKDHAAELAAFRQQQIDRTILHFTIDGQDIEITQGDLLKVEKHRVKELEERRDELQRNGGNPDELHRVNNLIDEHNTALDLTEHDPTNPDGMKMHQDLMKTDPEFAQEAKKYGSSAAHAVVDRRTSFSVESFGAGPIDAQSIKGPFTQSASPDMRPPVAPPASAPMVQTAKTAFSAAGF